MNSTASPATLWLGISGRDRILGNLGMSALGRFLPVATLLSDRQLLGDSGHSEKRHRSTDA
jgi:hypothetical protein